VFEAIDNPLHSDISRFVWKTRYRQRDKSGQTETGIQNTWQRVANACAAIEVTDQAEWAARYLDVLADFRFLPGGRILAGAGTEQDVTLLNCFVMGAIEDSLHGICDALKQSALTMQQGGGIGCDFSTLRPRGSQAGSVGRIASGPVSFMWLWDVMCKSLLSTNVRGGAMMATLRCDHPDILEFVTAKQTAGELSRFNLSVQVSDAFMDAVRNEDEWPLVFPAEGLATGNAATETEGETLMRDWPGYVDPVTCRVFRRIAATELWEAIMRSAYDYAEPGVMFVDRVNRLNNLGYREQISATNPCGEIPLPAYGACDLGSINLSRFVHAPFSSKAAMDIPAIRETTRTAIRLLDAVIDISHYPLHEQYQQAHGTRRIGLGVTGLADALIMLGLHYDSDKAREQAATLMRTICHSAYEYSVELAREKGAFPYLQQEPYLDSGFIQSLPAKLRDAIARHGIRNSHLLAIAPTGSISLLAENASTGIEPVFDFKYRHRVHVQQGRVRDFDVEDYALLCWREMKGEKPLPGYFITAAALPPKAHIAMQAALQPYVDNAISKTINIPEDYPFAGFRDIYKDAYEQGLKGLTVYRPSGGYDAPMQSNAREECGLYCSYPDEKDRTGN